LLNLPTQKQAITAPLIIISLALLCFFLPDNLAHQLDYDRQLISSGELWRFLTGHFNHTNTNHLLLNLAGLVALWALHGDHYQTDQYLSAFAYIAFITSGALFLFSPEMTRYVGLSGILHGIFVWGSIKDIERGWRSGYLLLFGVIAKIIWEQIYGASDEIIALIESQVATDAHLWGALAGGFFVAKEKLLASQTKSN
jgi:rhomboid family GlyGly-CTERM serine protease